MRNIILTIGLIISSYLCFGQTQIITTGNNVIDPTNPTAADIVIGSNAIGGIRHDGSMMWWSNASADRISNTSDEFYFSVWNTTIANIGLSAVVGGTSYFQGNVLIGQTGQVNSNYRLDVNGNFRANAVSIGTNTVDPNYMLSVEGKIHSQQVNVDMNGWNDYVFNDNYKLPTLSAIKIYVEKEHHLPGIPPEEEIVKNGLNLGEIDKLLTKKVEELTLYLIEKDEKEKEQQQQINSQQRQLDQALTKMQSQSEQLQSATAQLKSQQNQMDSQEEHIKKLEDIVMKLTAGASLSN